MCYKFPYFNQGKNGNPPESIMTFHSAISEYEQLSSKAEEMTVLATLIQRYPAEAQLLMAAVEDGLTLDPAQIMPVIQGHEQQDTSTPPTDIPAAEAAEPPDQQGEH